MYLPSPAAVSTYISTFSTSTSYSQYHNIHNLNSEVRSAQPRGLSDSNSRSDAPPFCSIVWWKVATYFNVSSRQGSFKAFCLMGHPLPILADPCLTLAGPSFANPCRSLPDPSLSFTIIFECEMPIYEIFILNLLPYSQRCVPSRPPSWS